MARLYHDQSPLLAGGFVEGKGIKIPPMFTPIDPLTGRHSNMPTYVAGEADSACVGLPGHGFYVVNKRSADGKSAGYADFPNDVPTHRILTQAPHLIDEQTARKRKLIKE